MKAENNGQRRYYRIDLAAAIRAEIKELKKAAALHGREEEFLQALKMVTHRLRLDPSTFGEVVKELRHFDMSVHVGSVFPITVRFAFHEAKRLVYITQIFLAQP